MRLHLAQTRGTGEGDGLSGALRGGEAVLPPSQSSSSSHCTSLGFCLGTCGQLGTSLLPSGRAVASGSPPTGDLPLGPEQTRQVTIPTWILHEVLFSQSRFPFEVLL